MEAGLRMKVRKVNMVVYTQSQRHCGLNLDDGNENTVKLIEFRYFLKYIKGLWDGLDVEGERREGLEPMA